MTEAGRFWRLAADQATLTHNLVLEFARNGAMVWQRLVQEAAHWYKVTADQRFRFAQYNLGVCYQHGHGVEKDLVRAVSLYTKAAEQGDADALFCLGGCQRGPGMAEDNVKAAQLYKLSADQGHAPQYYQHGQGMEKNSTEAVRLLRLAADQGNAVAQYSLARSFAENVIRRAWTRT